MANNDWLIPLSIIVFLDRLDQVPEMALHNLKRNNIFRLNTHQHKNRKILQLDREQFYNYHTHLLFQNESNVLIHVRQFLLIISVLRIIIIYRYICRRTL